jgi:hypothetical protein
MSSRILPVLVTLLVALLLSGCGATAAPAPEATASAPTATPLPTPLTQSTTPAAEQATPPVTRATATPQGADTTDWTVPPEGWQEHASQRWAVSFHVPEDWQETAPDHLVGEDGFAWLAPFEGPGTSVDQACEWLANYHRDRYGPAPGVMSVPRENVVDVHNFPCLILGGATEEHEGVEYEAAIVLVNVASASDQGPSFLQLSVDPGHALAIAGSLSYLTELPPVPTLSASSFGRELAPEEIPEKLPAQVENFGDLTLEDYTVVDATVDGPGYFEFLQRIPDAVLDVRRAWRQVPPEPPLEPVQVDGHRVAVEQLAYEGVKLPGQPVYATYVSVQMDGQEVYRYNMAIGHAAVFPLYYLGNWKGKWVVEANGMLIVDGAIVNQNWGYDEIFGCRQLNGRPFYFYVVGDKTYLSYGGEALPVSYDYVTHGHCCEPAAFNVAGNEQMVWFYALSERSWHYVELGAYGQ